MPIVLAGLYTFVIIFGDQNQKKIPADAYPAHMLTPYTIPVIYIIHQTNFPAHKKKNARVRNCKVNPLTADPDYVRFLIFLLAH